MKKTKSEVRALEILALKWHKKFFDKLTGIKEVNGKLKLITPENKEQYRMKKIVSSIKKVTLHLNILAIVLIFISCGDDNLTNTGNPPPASNDILILSLDSFNLSGIGNISADTLFNFIDTTHDSLKCTFTVVSNCDSLDFPRLNVTPGNFGENFLYSQLNQSYTLYHSKNDTFEFGLYSRFYSSTNKYIRVSNIKLYLR